MWKILKTSDLSVMSNQECQILASNMTPLVSIPCVFISKQRLEGHINMVHTNMANFKCGVCNELFKTRQSIVSHINKHFEKAFMRCGHYAHFTETICEVA